MSSQQEVSALHSSDGVAHPVFDFYTASEELANTITHGVGLILSATGFLFFIFVPNEPNHKLIFGLYALGVFFSYLTSTLYHGSPQGWRKHRLRLLDHAAIYLHIAATYTPYLALIGASWLSPIMLAVIWLVASVGAGFKLLMPDIDRFESWAVLSYLAMGWIFPLFVFDVYAGMPANTLWYLIIGGAFYTVGILFYRWVSLPYNHAIWHIFVMIAAAWHYWAAYQLYLNLAY